MTVAARNSLWTGDRMGDGRLSPEGDVIVEDF